MSVNLMHTNEAAAADQAAANWAAITAVANADGMVFIDEDTVNTIARLLDGQALTNGEVVTAYSYNDDDQMGALVCAFGPALLPTQVQDQVRDRLAASQNGKAAARLFDTVIRLGLQITLSGKEFCDAHIKGVNWPGDEVEINRTASNMARMFGELGLDSWNEDTASRNVPLDVFAKAVNDNGFRTDMPERLQSFVECARRHAATHVYWA